MSDAPADPDALARGARPRSIGARIRRVEDPRLLTGHGSFTDDRIVPDALHVAFRRSDHAHALIRSVDVAAAAALPGVVAVLTAADLADLAPVRATSRMRDYHATAQAPLATGKVRYVGEPVVAVLAESRYLAEDALELVEIAFEGLGPVSDPEAAAREGATLLHEEAGTNVLARREFARGDVEAAMAQAPVRVGGRFRMHRKTPAAMENRSYLAEYDRGRRLLTLTSSTQIPGIVRDLLVELLDLPGHGVRVVAPDVGGGFGGKASLYQEEVLVAVLARRLGRPVRWTSDRLEDLISTSQGFDERVEAELGLDADGRILALRADVVGDVGAYSIYPWTAALEPVQVVSFLPGPYRVPAYRGRVRAVCTSKAPTGPYRGVGRPVSTFVMERLIDMAAGRLGLDPAEIRRRNLVRPDEFPYRTASGIVWDRSAFTESLAAVLEAADYAGLRAAQARARAEGRLVGIGLATYAELTGIGSRISAAPGMPINTGTEQTTIRLDSTGAVTAAFGVASHGQGLETTLAQVIADELGCRIEDVQILQGDSAAVAHGTGTYASRSAVLGGGAATLASRDLKAKLLRAASHLLEAGTDDLEARDGAIRVAGTDRAVTFRQVARAVYSEMGRLPKDAREELESTRVYDPFFGTATSATHLCLLEIDPATCRVRLDRLVVAEDCGRIINPMIVDGQVHGAVAQGIGAALYEEVVYDAGGQLLSASLADYVVPAASEVPPIDIVHLEAELPATVGGFRGMGEGGTIGAPAAIANALADALSPFGIAVTELPVTPERLFRLMAAARTPAASNPPKEPSSWISS
ncbi:Caffeine dehydrogenase subunit alpha [Methylobacterium crusticola]|uniref:Caffeine dehydrogenase subunit alpha n=1 Tax=Methylobacterium crusticola TaxID=1697972 RepID=A0ABQ4R6U5_9HYPH|nr:xanthine dehydrogenase family protein molybdopterin-binding subunit [Methylobacterium crusticola]GJD53147.1 Caffeine dehydrogenase subunit alpha [Methylobacterium crusticola]